MELEELMANRALLMKMSAQDEIPMRVLRKSPRVPKRNTDNTEVNKITPNRHIPSLSISRPSLNIPSLNNPNRSGKKVDDGIPPHVVFVPEGYGCKMPKSLRRCTQRIKILFLLLYVFGMPIVLFQLHTNLQHTKRRILNLDEEELNYLREEVSYKKRKTSEVDDTKKVDINDRMGEYAAASSFEKDTYIEMKAIKLQIMESERRYSFLSFIHSFILRVDY